MRGLMLACLIACPVFVSSQAPVPEPPSRPAQPGAAATPSALPIKRVVLYKTGVGYFEHLGDVRDTQNVTVRFNSAQLNDVLKSLTVLDLGKGRIAGISYNSVAPLEQRLGALRLPLNNSTTALQMLGSLRGARIEVTSGGSTVEGRLLAVEQRQKERDNELTTVDTFSIVSDSGEIRTFEMSPAVRVRVVERDLRQEIGRYLDLVGSTREQDVRSMVIATSGSGQRPLFVSYISEVPIWKSTYRLVLSTKGRPLLQGWAIVDNTIGEDWSNVQLSLVAGAPQSFIQNISQPYYGQRPVVPMPRSVSMSPQTHTGTLEATPPAPPPPPPAPAMNRQSFMGTPAPGAGAGRGGAAGGVVGGLPEPAMDALKMGNVYEQARNVDPMAAGSSLGDLFEYRIKEPITVRKNQSALVPIVNAEIDAEKVSLWNRAAGSGRPLRAVWLTNATGLTLDGGSMTLIDGEAFAGEGLIESLKPGERRLLSYAADLGTLVDARMDTSASRVARIRAREGIIIQENEDRATWIYKARNENSTPVALVVEHQLRPGWTLAPGQTPAENTTGAARFRVPVAPASEALLEVREVRKGETRITLDDLNDALLLRLTQSGIAAGTLEAALKPVLAKRAELAGLERQLEGLQAERNTIVEDQQRLRENMKALRGSAEEKQLLQRYTRQLDEQESRLDVLKGAIAQTTAARDKARAELSQLIQNLSFDLPAAPSREPAGLTASTSLEAR
jgi:hypothetical protein